jgi:hypothetical protein
MQSPPDASRDEGRVVAGTANGARGAPSDLLASRLNRQDRRVAHGRRQRDKTSRQDRGTDGRAWTVSWMSMNRIGQYPGRGSGREERDRKNPINVTEAEASQMITPTARTHGVDPDDITTTPAIATASPRDPTRRAQTAILQCALFCSSGGSSTLGIIPPLSAPSPGCEPAWGGRMLWPPAGRETSTSGLATRIRQPSSGRPSSRPNAKQRERPTLPAVWVTRSAP